MPSDTSVRAARAALSDDHIHMLLLTDRGKLRGTLIRDDLPDHQDHPAPALTYGVLEGRTVFGDASAEETRLHMIRRGHRRLAVINDEGDLLGLLCLKRRLAGFCSDDDVTARAAARDGGT